MDKNLSLAILITTMNEGIERVKKELIPQLKNVDEIVISHQITNKNLQPEEESLGDNVKYLFMREKGLSKNRNNALKHATADICHICDDDLNFIPGFEKIIKQYYTKTKADIITFQAKNEQGKKHFQVSEGKHSIFSVLRIWSWGITFDRKKLIKNSINFDEKFGLGTKYHTGEENIFLTECYKKGIKMYHSDKSIVAHPDESSGIDYKDREDLVIARIKVFKHIYGILGGISAILYFTIMHYRYYKRYFSIWGFFILSCKGLKNER